MNTTARISPAPRYDFAALDALDALDAILKEPVATVRKYNLLKRFMPILTPEAKALSADGVYAAVLAALVANGTL